MVSTKKLTDQGIVPPFHILLNKPFSETPNLRATQ